MRPTLDKTTQKALAASQSRVELHTRDDQEILHLIRDLERLRPNLSAEQYERIKQAIQDFARKQDRPPKSVERRNSTDSTVAAVSGNVMQAQRIIGAAMGWCLALWFTPLVSGLVVNQREQSMVRDVLVAMGKQPSEKMVDSLFWCCRKRLLVLNIATYVPVAGTAFQLFEVYALGQFTIYCAKNNLGQADERELLESWKAIEFDIFSGSRVVAAYEESTGKTFPSEIKGEFFSIVDSMRDAYRTAERIPGLMRSQEIAGEAIRQTLKGAKGLLHRLVKRAKAGAS